MPVFQFCPQCAEKLVDREDSGRQRRACSSSTCGYVQYDNPTPVVAAIVEHEGQIILVRNKGWPEKWYGLVTGFLERSETPETGVIRELKEELGLDGTIVSFVGHYNFDQMNQLIIAYHVRATGELVVGEELEAFKRVSPEKLRPWPFGTGQAVSDWLARRQAPET